MKRQLLYTFILVCFCSGLVACKIKNSASGGVKPAPVSPKVPDPLLPYLWHLKNTGQLAFSTSTGTGGADINLDDLYELGFTGKGVVVAVSDSNIDMDHEDLVKNANISLSRNYLKSTSSEWPGSRPISSNNTASHGTSVMGIIGAVAENGLGGKGVAPEVTLVGFNFIDSNQSLTRKLDQAKGPIDVFNYSYGSGSCTVIPVEPTYVTQLKYGVTTQRNGKGSIYVKAAGNEYSGDVSDCSPLYTGPYLGNTNLEQVNTYPYTILAAALTADGILTDYSTPGAGLWISAPGGENGVDAPGVISTDLPGCTKGYSKTSATGNNFDKGKDSLNKSCNYTSGLQGTSFSSPIVAGAVAVLLQVNPDLTWRDVKHILASTAVQIDLTANNSLHPLGQNLAGHLYDQGWVENAAHYKFHNWYGFGRLDLKSAVTMAQSYTFPLGDLVETKDNDGNWLYQSGDISLAIPDNSAAGVTNSINVASNLVVESVQISVSILHDFSTDLGIEITSPSGTVSTVMNINSGILTGNMINTQFLSNAFYGEPSNGNWRIKVVDGAAQDTGILTSWKINIYGHAP